MSAILKCGRVIPDCFACGTCINTCPVNAIHSRAGKREMPPSGTFDAEKNRYKRMLMMC